MRYLILSADYNSFLTDEFDRDFEYTELNLSTDLLEKLKDWYTDYYPIIQKDDRDRLAENNRIIKLDKEGIELAKAIMSELEGVKVKYYSEGLLKYLSY